MRAADYLGYTWRNVARARLRLGLTILAVVIGATLVVVMTSIGGGVQRNVVEQIRAAGGLNEIGVSSFGAQFAPVAARPGVLNQAALDAVEAIPGVSAVLPEILLMYLAELRYDEQPARALLVGVPPERMAAYGFTAAQGDVAPAPGQVVLGARVAESFLGPDAQHRPAGDLYGSTLRLVMRRLAAPPAPGPGTGPGFGAPGFAPQVQQQERALAVVGILQPLGTQDDFTAWLHQDDVLDALEWTTGRRPDLTVDGYHAVRVKAASTDLVRPVQEQITALDLQATSLLSALDQVNRQMLVLQLLLGTIGLVALVVSGLGVANTMLMATFERTREVGILKALGATDGQVARLFLLEASGIGLLGALVGLAFGWLATQVVNFVVLQMLVGQMMASGIGVARDAPRTVLETPGWVPLVVLALAWLVAVLAGLYPALRAARLNIAQALRAD
ncbi:MAG TPA: ABC transporter permease [Chloroflexota bacterium]|nr:ABC transporter permease [Chloroflexota bacterium]